jgi:hypothetical protein
MICNNCRYQSPDGLNFCPNCGIAFNPQFARPYQPPQPSFQQPNFQQGFPGASVGISSVKKSDKHIFTIGIVAFGIKIFWILLSFFGYGIFGSFFIISQFLALISSVTVLFLCMIYVKKQTNKTLLIIFFSLLCLFEIYETFFLGNFGRIF